MDDRQFRLILEQFGLSRKGYRRVRQGVKKRLARHMRRLGCGSTDEYLRVLRGNPAEREEAQRLLTVSISRFFRDRALWKTIAREIIPGLMKLGISTVRVWSAGCACGEEARSFKILWDAAQREKGEGSEIRIWATDINPEVLDRARLGIYPASSLRSVPVGIRDDYFQPLADGKWRIANCMQEEMQWSRSDLLNDASPRKDFHLIFLRNSVFTYCREDLQRVVLAKVTEGLLPGGFLIIGAREKLPAGFTGLRSFSGHPQIFQKERLRGEG